MVRGTSSCRISFRKFPPDENRETKLSLLRLSNTDDAWRLNTFDKSLVDKSSRSFHRQYSSVYRGFTNLDMKSCGQIIWSL